MNRSKRRITTRTAAAVVLLALLWLAMLTLGAGPVDDRLLAIAYAGERPILAEIARLLTLLGEGPTVILAAVAAAAWMLWRGLSRSGMAIVVVTLAGRLLVVAQKYGIARLRPADEAHLVPVHSPSFPSAHAANSMIAYVTIALILSAAMPHRRPLLVSLALALSLAIGLSRVILGVHYPSDVVGGWAFGLLWVIVAVPLAQQSAR